MGDVNKGARSVGDVAESLAGVLEAVRGMKDVMLAGAQGNGYPPEQCGRLACVFEQVANSFTAEWEALYAICGG